jgi:hypothetical protein
VRPLFGWRRVRQGRWGLGNRADAWSKRGTSRGVPADRWAALGLQRPETGGRTVRALPAEQRGRGEADGWATATVPSGGAADEQGPSGSGRGREERGTDRRDRPVSGRGWRGGCSLRGTRVGRPGKEKGGPSPDE